MKTRAVIWCKEPVNVPGIAWKDYDSETAFQVYCADWLRKQFELTGLDGYRYWHHSANERFGARAGFIAKMMGQAKGFPDFVHLGMRLCLELKLPGKVAKREQIEWGSYLIGIGWTFEIVYGFERFREIVEGKVASVPRGTLAG